MHNFFISLKVCCIHPNISGSEKSRLWVGIGGSKKNRLWCLANGMSGKQCYSKCSKWPPSARIHASSLKSPLINCIVHHAVLKFSPCHNKTHLQLVHIADWYSIGVKNEKTWKICAFYKVVRWHVSGVVGKGVTVCFLLR